MSDGIPETVSENPGQPKRGRPPVLSAVGASLLQDIFSDNLTHRSRQDCYYRARAQKRLDDGSGRFSWLVDRQAIMAGKPRAFKQTILSALGRIDDDDDLRAVAARICELKPTARDAVRMIRRWRGKDKGAEPDAGDLAWALIRAVNDYIGGHPGTTWEHVRTALDIAVVACRDHFHSNSEEPDDDR